MLREGIAELKSNLNDKDAPFGVDLLIPQVCVSVYLSYLPLCRAQPVIVRCVVWCGGAWLAGS